MAVAAFVLALVGIVLAALSLAWNVVLVLRRNPRRPAVAEDTPKTVELTVVNAGSTAIHVDGIDGPSGIAPGAKAAIVVAAGPAISVTVSTVFEQADDPAAHDAAAEDGAADPADADAGEYEFGNTVSGSA